MHRCAATSTMAEGSPWNARSRGSGSRPSGTGLPSTASARSSGSDGHRKWAFGSDGSSPPNPSFRAATALSHQRRWSRASVSSPWSHALITSLHSCLRVCSPARTVHRHPASPGISSASSGQRGSSSRPNSRIASAISASTDPCWGSAQASAIAECADAMRGAAT